MNREIINSSLLERTVVLDLVLPVVQTTNKETKILLVNDGQDAEAIQLESILQNLQNLTQTPILAIAIHVGERKQEYGVAREPDFAKRGAKAGQYAAFIEKELVSWIKQKFHFQLKPENTAIIGFSLGALSAFDIAWNHPHFIGCAGLFSGSFWWRAKSLEDGYTSKDRIAHKMVGHTHQKPPLRLWFQTGGMDEYADRDKDGLIDSIGDTLDLMLALEKNGYVPGKDLEYVEMPNGKHDHKTMAKLLPAFLAWWLEKK